VVFCHFFARHASLDKAKFAKRQQQGKGTSSSSSSSGAKAVDLFNRMGYMSRSEAVLHWFETDLEHMMAQVRR
jgi:hypothetical protein